MKLTILASALAGGLAMLPASGAVAEQFTLATFLGPNHVITQYQSTEWAENVKEATGGSVSFNLITGGALMPVAGTLDGLAAGIAQVSLMATTYTPSNLPIMNTVTDLANVTPEPYVLAFAFSDFNFNEKVARDEWKKAGLVFGASHATPTYHLMCRGNVSTLEDLKGLKVRTGGSSWARGVESLGMVAVSVPINEAYTAMERGALDCMDADLSHLTSGASIGELVGSIVTVDMAPYFNTAGIIYNRDFWGARTDAERQAMMDQAVVSIVRTTQNFDLRAQKALEWAKEREIRITPPSEDLQAAYDKWAREDEKASVETVRKELGVENAGEIREIFEGYIEKWQGLLDGVDVSDGDALVKLFRENALADFDMSQYGLD